MNFGVIETVPKPAGMRESRCHSCARALPKRIVDEALLHRPDAEELLNPGGDAAIHSHRDDQRATSVPKLGATTHHVIEGVHVSLGDRERPLRSSDEILKSMRAA